MRKINGRLWTRVDIETEQGPSPGSLPQIMIGRVQSDQRERILGVGDSGGAADMIKVCMGVP
jgi:hypothetical protein